jgi:hypothetical protein
MAQNFCTTSEMKNFMYYLCEPEYLSCHKSGSRLVDDICADHKNYTTTFFNDMTFTMVSFENENRLTTCRMIPKVLPLPLIHQ